MKFFNDSILELRVKIINLHPDKRYEFFERASMQEALKKFNGEEVVNLYELFPPEDAYKFFQLSLIQDKLKKEISSSDIDCEDILSYFKDKEIKKAVKSLLDPHPRQPNTLDTNKVTRI